MARRKKGEKINGWINLDKPAGLTSTQAMAKVRKALNAQKAGHAGTLDPLATGILPIALGEATKTIPYVQDSLKTYSFTVTWGEQTDTDDAEGDVIATSELRPTEEAIKAALPVFIGEIEQTPPRFSAIKINGERAYDLARQAQEFEMKSRKVFVEHLELVSFRTPQAEKSQKERGDSSHALGMTESSDFIMTCGKGTYVRSLARDLALKLGTVGHISALRREAVGPFEAKEAILLDKLQELGDKSAAKEVLLPLSFVLDDIPALDLKADEVTSLRNGQVVSLISRPDFERLSKAGIEGKDPQEAVAIFQDQAIALIEVQGPKIKPVRVFNL